MSYNYQALAELRGTTPRQRDLAHELAAEVQQAADGPLLRARERTNGYADGVGMCPEVYLLEYSVIYRDKIHPFYEDHYNRNTICFLTEALIRYPGAPEFRALSDQDRYEYSVFLPDGTHAGWMRNAWGSGFFAGSEPEWVFQSGISETVRKMVKATWSAYRNTYREWGFQNNMSA